MHGSGLFFQVHRKRNSSQRGESYSIHVKYCWINITFSVWMSDLTFKRFSGNCWLCSKVFRKMFQRDGCPIPILSIYPLKFWSDIKIFIRLIQNVLKCQRIEPIDLVEVVEFAHVSNAIEEKIDVTFLFVCRRSKKKIFDKSNKSYCRQHSMGECMSSEEFSPACRYWHNLLAQWKP